MVEKKPKRLTRREFMVLAGSATAASLLTSCVVTPATPLPEAGKAEPTEAPAKTAAEATKAPAVVSAGPKGQIIYGQAEPPTSAQWDDQTVFGLVDFQVAGLVQDRLMEFDENMQVVPRLATDWQYVDQGTLEINLRQGVKYHDGTEFTAQDVKAVIDRVSSDTAIAHNAFWAPVKVEITGDYQVRISSDPPFGPLIPVLATTSMLPKSFIENPEKFKEGDIGAGPFRFVEYKNNRVVLEANEEYWDGAPGVKNIIFDYIEDWNARTNALLAGDVDIITRCSSEQLDAVKDNPEFYVVENSPAIGVVSIYQHNNPIIANKKVRQAMAYAIDRQTILEQIMAGVGKIGYNMLPTGTLFYEPLAEKYEYSPDKAKALLDESGLKDLKLKMSTSTLVPHQKEIDLAIVQYLADVGIQVDIETLEVGQFRTTYPQYDISLNTFGSPGGDPDFILGVYAGPIGQAVFHLQDNPEIQDFVPLQDKQRQQTDPEARQKAVTEAADWLWAFQPTLELSDELWPFIINERVSGYKRNRTFSEPLARYATVKS
jgi:peptide/nickel transport system substrate-binding protein